MDNGSTNANRNIDGWGEGWRWIDMKAGESDINASVVRGSGV